MITVKQAQRLIAQNIPALLKERVPLAESLGCILAEGIRVPFDLPLFDNSAMDGYALRAGDTQKAAAGCPVYLEIKRIIKAGDNPKRPLKRNECYRIMTGALIPNGADTILPKEEAGLPLQPKADQPQAEAEKMESGGRFLGINHPIGKGKHIRYQGEEIKKGEKVLNKGNVINPGTVGFLSSLGKNKVLVFRKPKVSLIATGSELVASGKKLARGKIYDSNSPMITCALRQMEIEPASVRQTADKPTLLKKEVSQALRRSDVLVLMGGVSVGDYDYVKEILGEFGVRNIFWKVSQKPGKPVYFGKKGKKLIFGLPGNPASVFVCFYEYVFPALRAMMGFKDFYLPMETFPLGEAVRADEKKSLFLKGKVSSNHKGKIVFPLKHQGSHMISSLCQADCLLVVAPGGTVIRKGKKIKIHLLP